MHVWFWLRVLLGKSLTMDNMCGPSGILRVCVCMHVCMRKICFAAASQQGVIEMIQKTAERRQRNINMYELLAAESTRKRKTGKDQQRRSVSAGSSGRQRHHVEEQQHHCQEANPLNSQFNILLYAGVTSVTCVSHR